MRKFYCYFKTIYYTLRTKMSVRWAG